MLSTTGTIVPRFMAASFDQFLAMVAAYLTAINLDGVGLPLQTVAFVAVYLGYYFVFEGAFGRTPGKFSVGLIVVRSSGERCSWLQALVRTLVRFVEVNPALLGAIPAGLLIIFTKRRQRLGDLAAGTMVVRASLLKSASESIP